MRAAPVASVPPRIALRTFALALAVRLLVVMWAASRVPPTADGKFYHVVAGRIAQGDGYTWLWPDGAVTYAAHYPVGYPALLGAAYWLVGVSPVVAMLLNAVLGAAGCAAVSAVAHDVFARRPDAAWTARGAWLTGVLAALLPSLVLYTPALMTEGAVASTMALALWCAIALRLGEVSGQRRSVRRGQWLALGLLCGAATLLRPQCALFAPVLGWIAVPGREGPRVGSRLLAAVAVSSAVLATCAPWTLRNCEKMERCVFVSANGGWNLLIGTFPEGQGAWVPIDGRRVPEDCRTVFQEAAKDRCFGDAALGRISQDPLGWLALAPAKLRQTFDFTAAAADHLREAGALGSSAYRAVAALELGSQRLLHVLAALGLLLWARGGRASPVVTGVLFLGAVVGFGGLSATLGWAGVIGLALVSGALRASGVVLFCCSAVALTAVVHGVFFGAGRYALPLSLWCAPLAALGAVGLNVLTGRRTTGDNSQHGPH